MPTVDLVYDLECPHVALARANLMRAFSKAGVAARWQEHRIGDPDAVTRVRGFGSPTVLVDGCDVAGLEPAAESCCRIYAEGHVSTGAPSVDAIATVLAAAPTVTSAVASSNASDRPSRLRSSFAALPALGIALMPKVVCPLCWPAYAGVLSATGLTFLMDDTWLLPISAALLLAALGALGWKARARRGYGPTLLGAMAVALILAGKFVLGSSAVVYGGIAALVGASIWNAWPRRAAVPSCSACMQSTQK
jgi:mercuric ion transport protein